ncbi:MAG: RnfABCDGE type electron transport complex subunit D [Tissierellia bacterium]|nr:RnfABCDGE type electron transport complex subunit D [Tissierellia bacterium]
MEKNVLKTDSRSMNGHEYYVSMAPHIRSNDSVTKIMRDVIIALIPAMIGAIYYFGYRAAILMAVSIVTCVGTEYLYQKLTHRPIRIGDLSSLVTGILIAFNVPASMPWWMVALGGIFAILVVKECFGGIGFNFMNPALAARIVMMASWAQNMTYYVTPEEMKNWSSTLEYTASAATDAVTTATPLQMIAAGNFQNLPPLKDMALGNIGGVLGETSAILLLIGFIYLVVRKVVTIEIPVVYIAVTAIFLVILGVPVNIIPYEILGGGLILGACFMATDYATNPINKKGKIIFAIGCGIITAVIRTKASLPEGVSYAICLMNVATPLIDKLTRTSAYGEAK